MPGVAADDATGLVHDVARAVLFADELVAVAAVEILGIRLVGDGEESALAGEAPHVGLGHASERKHRARELLLRKPVQEIALVARALGRAQEPAAAAGAVAVGAGVVHLDLLALCAVEQYVEDVV